MSVPRAGQRLQPEESTGILATSMPNEGRSKRTAYSRKKGMPRMTSSPSLVMMVPCIPEMRGTHRMPSSPPTRMMKGPTRLRCPVCTSISPM